MDPLTITIASCNGALLWSFPPYIRGEKNSKDPDLCEEDVMVTVFLMFKALITVYIAHCKNRSRKNISMADRW